MTTSLRRLRSTAPFAFKALSLAAAAGLVAFAAEPEVGEAEPNLHSVKSRALQAIRDAGGTYGVRLEGTKEFREKAVALGYDERMYYEVRRISLGPHNAGADQAPPLGDEELAALSEVLGSFTTLEVLDLTGAAGVSIAGIDAVPPLPSLTHLRLTGTGVGDGLAEIIDRFPALTHLELAQTGVGDEEVERIRAARPALEIGR